MGFTIKDLLDVDEFGFKRWETSRKLIYRAREDLINCLLELGAIGEKGKGYRIRGDEIFTVKLETFDKIRRSLSNLPIDHEEPEYSTVNCDFCDKEIGKVARLSICAYDEGYYGGHSRWITILASSELTGKEYEIKYKRKVTEADLRAWALTSIPPELYEGKVVEEKHMGEACYECVGRGLEPKIKEKFEIEDFDLKVK